MVWFNNEWLLRVYLKEYKRVTNGSTKWWTQSNNHTKYTRQINIVLIEFIALSIVYFFVLRKTCLNISNAFKSYMITKSYSDAWKKNYLITHRILSIA